MILPHFGSYIPKAPKRGMNEHFIFRQIAQSSKSELHEFSGPKMVNKITFYKWSSIT